MCIEFWFFEKIKAVNHNTDKAKKFLNIIGEKIPTRPNIGLLSSVKFKLSGDKTCKKKINQITTKYNNKFKTYEIKYVNRLLSLSEYWPKETLL